MNEIASIGEYRNFNKKNRKEILSMGNFEGWMKKNELLLREAVEKYYGKQSEQN